MEDRKLTEKESLEIITSMIARTTERYIGNANILLMWGYLVVLTTIAVWILLDVTHNNAWNWLWFAIPVVGFTAGSVMKKNHRGRKTVKTYSDRVTSKLWTIVGVSEIVVAILCLLMQCFADVNCWSAMLVYSLLVVPCAEIAQGILLRENSLFFGGLVGLTVGVITLCLIVGGIVLYANWYLPIFIIAFVAMMIIPGHILNYKAKNQ